MTSRLVVASLCAAALSSAALAATGDPQRHLNVADQAWARSIRLQRADLAGSAWQARPPRFSTWSPGCRRPDEADLIVTGTTRDLEFAKPGGVVGSDARVFASAAQAGSAWTRGVRRPVTRCLVAGLRTMFSAPGARLVVRSSGRLPTESLAPRFAAYRVAFALVGPEGRFDGRFDYYRLARGRGVGVLAVMSFTRPVEPVPAAAERRLVALVAKGLRR